jgi:hypothetical protein
MSKDLVSGRREQIDALPHEFVGATESLNAAAAQLPSSTANQHFRNHPPNRTAADKPESTKCRIADIRDPQTGSGREI